MAQELMATVLTGGVHGGQSGKMGPRATSAPIRPHVCLLRVFHLPEDRGAVAT